MVINRRWANNLIEKYHYKDCEGEKRMTVSEMRSEETIFRIEK